MITNKPLRPCNKPGCSTLTSDGYCDKHKQVYRDERESSYKRGYNSKWRKDRAEWLAKHPFCVVCNSIATEVDHKTPHKGDMKLFWDKTNWQSMCSSCHSAKTAREDGGFGNKRTTPHP